MLRAEADLRMRYLASAAPSDLYTATMSRVAYTEQERRLHVLREADHKTFGSGNVLRLSQKLN